VFGPTTKIWMQIDPYCQWQKCSPVNVLSSVIRVMQIFAGVWEIWGIKQESGRLRCWFSYLSLVIFSESSSPRLKSATHSIYVKLLHKYDKLTLCCRAFTLALARLSCHLHDDVDSLPYRCKDPDILIKAFSTYVKPRLEYCSPVWSPMSVTVVNDLESVQRRFTKPLPGFKSHSYDDRCARLGIDRLELRRLRDDLILCYKILHGLVFIVVWWFFTKVRNRATREHSFYARQHIIYAIARICHGNSVCLSVRHTGGSVKNGWS